MTAANIALAVTNAILIALVAWQEMTLGERIKKFIVEWVHDEWRKRKF